MPTLNQDGLIVLLSLVFAFGAFLVDKNPNNPFILLASNIVSYYWGKNSK